MSIHDLANALATMSEEERLTATRAMSDNLQQFAGQAAHSRGPDEPHTHHAALGGGRPGRPGAARDHRS